MVASPPASIRPPSPHSMELGRGYAVGPTGWDSLSIYRGSVDLGKKEYIRKVHWQKRKIPYVFKIS
jgi:hypothetical protein